MRMNLRKSCENRGTRYFFNLTVILTFISPFITADVVAEWLRREVQVYSTSS